MDRGDIGAAWRLAYARQSLSDFRVYDLLCMRVDIDDCQRMHYLQMALEKAAKAHYWNPSSTHENSKVNRQHRVVEKLLPVVYKSAWFNTKGHSRISGQRMKAIRALCREVDLLAPAVLNGELRRDNCEYPWRVVDAEGKIHAIRSPLDHEFAPSSMVTRPGTAGFLKAIRSSIQGITSESVDK